MKNPFKRRKISKKLEAFLIKNNALEHFLANKKRTIKSTGLYDAFLWSSTLQGYSYWSELNDKFTKEIK